MSFSDEPTAIPKYAISCSSLLFYRVVWAGLWYFVTDVSKDEDGQMSDEDRT